MLPAPSKGARVPQDHPTNNPVIDAARRELSERAKTTAPLRTAADAYAGPGRIVSINTSAHKGTRKTPVADGHDAVIKQFGLASDAHAGHWHRQVSFLAAESIQTAQARGLDVHKGDFGENFTTQGINLLTLPLGTQLKIGNVLHYIPAYSAMNIFYRSCIPSVRNINILRKPFDINEYCS